MPTGGRSGGPPTARPILLVEDEPALAESVQYSLEREGYRVVIAADGQRGVERFRAEQPVLLLLDLMLPRLSGLDVCRTVRAESTVPIVMLTAKDSEADIVTGLEIGADDYVTKPFSTRELVSRVRANIRRVTALAEPGAADLLTGGPVELDVARHEVRVRGRPVPMTPKEFELLQTFLRGKNRLRSRDYLIEAVWGPRYFGDTKTLDVHMKRLRQKVERDPHTPEHLVTVRGLGYRFLDSPDAAPAELGGEIG